MGNSPLGKKIKELRKKLGLTQEALAERVGVTRLAVSNWESGKSIPKGDKLMKLAEVFGVSASELLVEGNEAEVLDFLEIRDSEVEEFLRHVDILKYKEVSNTSRELLRRWTKARLTSLAVEADVLLHILAKLEKLENKIKTIEADNTDF